MSYYRVVLACMSLMVLVSCNHKATTAADARPDSVLKPKYATGFAIEYYPRYKCVVVYNPWKRGAVQARYYIRTVADVPTPDPNKTILAPIKSIAATSATHYAFIAALNELPSITGVASPKLIYNQDLIRQCKSGKTIDLGDAFSLNVEKTLALKPQALMMSSYNQADVAADRIVQSGIPVIFNNEWMENSPLGRAEWIKFVAALYNKDRSAALFFGQLEKRYQAMSKLALTAKETPSVMLGGSFKGTWYMPSGKGFMGRLLSDAKVSYHFANDTTTGSIPVNFEQALQYFSNARIWLNSDANSLKALVQSDARYSLFRACKEKQVYSLNKRINATGGNDYWEAGVLHPDLILADFIKAVHPELLPNYSSYYIMKIK